MRLRKSTRYALCAVLDLATAPDERPVRAADIAERHGIPEAVVSKVLQELVRAGLVSGTRGAAGGYRLLRSAAEISVLDVLAVFESPPQLAEPVTSSEALGLERLADLLGAVDRDVRGRLESVTLAALVSSHEWKELVP